MRPGPAQNVVGFLQLANNRGFVVGWGVKEWVPTCGAQTLIQAPQSPGRHPASSSACPVRHDLALATYAKAGFRKSPGRFRAASPVSQSSSIRRSRAICNKGVPQMARGFLLSQPNREKGLGGTGNSSVRLPLASRISRLINSSELSPSRCSNRSCSSFMADAGQYSQSFRNSHPCKSSRPSPNG